MCRPEDPKAPVTTCSAFPWVPSTRAGSPARRAGRKLLACLVRRPMRTPEVRFMSSKPLPLVAALATAVVTWILPMTLHADGVATPPVAERIPHPVTLHGETRADDRASEAAMEDRKRVGYF